MTVSQNVEPTYGIAAVSRLTGIPVDTLRVWERRYQIVTPERTENKRVYTHADVGRLTLIKQLVDHGHAISAVAHKSGTELLELNRIHLESQAPTPPTHQPLRILAFGDSLPFLLSQWKDSLSFIDLIGCHQSFLAFEDAVKAEKPDLLILEMPALHHENLVEIRNLVSLYRPQKIVVIYTFGMKVLLNELDKMGIVTMRSPVTVNQLRQICMVDAGNQSPNPIVIQTSGLPKETIPVRRFDSKMLAAAATVKTKIQCECPQHLADLLFRLNAFEAYSADCENRNDQDAALHQHLHQETARARAILEDALDYLIQCENIELV